MLYRFSLMDEAFPGGPSRACDTGLPRPSLRTVKGEALCLWRVVGQKAEPFSLHPPAALAGDPPNLPLPADADITARQAANPADLAVIPAPAWPATGAAVCFLTAARA